MREPESQQLLPLSTPGPSMHEGSGAWLDGLCAYSWTLRDVSDRNALMRTAGRSVFLVVKAKLRERQRFDRLLWIQYTEARVDGKVYVPPISPMYPNGWPWRGIDRYPNNARNDPFPYSNLPGEQDATDRGAAYGGRVRSLYSPGDADSVFVDWASSGGNVSWEHYSVLSLVAQGRAGSDEWRLGSLAWGYKVGADGGLSFGGRPADAADIATWFSGLAEGHADYARAPFQGDYRVNS